MTSGELAWPPNPSSLAEAYIFQQKIHSRYLLKGDAALLNSVGYTSKATFIVATLMTGLRSHKNVPLSIFRLFLIFSINVTIFNN